MDERKEMIALLRERYGLNSPDVFSAMLKVPREKFVDKKYRDTAYRDGPVPIAQGQTMSQPYTVAFMTDLLLGGDEPHSVKQSLRLRQKASRGKRVLEIGTGSGYQAAVLSHLAKKVFTVEIIRQLADRAKKRLKKLGYKNVHVKSGSGEWGWKEHAPFDAILITAGIEKETPQTLLDQLKDGGVLVAPIGKGPDKVMTKFRKIKGGKIKKSKHGIFHFVPFVKEPN